MGCDCNVGCLCLSAVGHLPSAFAPAILAAHSYDLRRHHRIGERGPCVTDSRHNGNDIKGNTLRACRCDYGEGCCRSVGMAATDAVIGCNPKVKQRLASFCDRSGYVWQGVGRVAKGDVTAGFWIAQNCFEFGRRTHPPDRSERAA